jgi:hypothetical protein
MKFTVKTKDSRRAALADKLCNWHRKFAWLPVKVTTVESQGSDDEHYVWLSFVYRRFKHDREVILRSNTNPFWFTGSAWEYIENEFEMLKIQAIEKVRQDTATLNQAKYNSFNNIWIPKPKPPKRIVK